MSRVREAAAQLERREREKDLASDGRAGVFANQKARERQRDVVVQIWHRLALMCAAVLCGVLVPLYFVPNDALRGFIAGLVVASLGWFCWWLVILLSGTAHTMAGELGEQWSAGQLRALQKSGWKLINGLRLRQFDIDHIAIGPGGILVVETKWSAEPWNTRVEASDFRVGPAVTRLRRSALDVQGFLRPRLDVRPQPILFLWGPGYRDLPETAWRREIDGVQLLAQPALDDWAPEPREGVLSPAEVDHAWQVLDRHLRSLESKSKLLMRQRSLMDRAGTVWASVWGFCGGVVISALSWRPLGEGLWFFVAAAILGVALAVTRTLVPYTRVLTTAVLLGTEFIAALFLLLKIAVVLGL